ncbi:MAG: S8 family serine peptidase [Promethearchaeota archaeon]
MTKFKNKYHRLVLTFIFTSLLFTPIIGIGVIQSNSNDFSQKSISNFDPLSSSIKNHLNTEDQELDTQLDNKFTKYDAGLKDYLFNLTISNQNSPKNTKVIVLFDSKINKVKRIGILDSTFEEYEILANYDIIPGTYIKVSSDQLIGEEKIIEGIQSIKKVYKPKMFQNPYISEDNLQLSALKQNSYPNWWLPAIGAENLAYNGSGVRVAVVDTGMFDHPALNIVENKNFVSNESASNYQDDVGHGTHVGGIIAGDGTGSDGEYRGVAPGALLINAKAGNASGLGEADIISAIEWSSEPKGLGGADADIISMSFGGGYPYISDLITQAISNAKEKYGVIFVASAGNEGPDYFTGSTPAAGVNVISVGASDKNNELASFSSWGPTFGYLGYPDVVAPGVNIISTEAKDSIISSEEHYKGDYFDFTGDADYIPLSGTSMSCPMVSGALAILKEAFPNLTPEAAKIALLEGARKLPNEQDEGVLKSGAGLINVSASLSYLDSQKPNYNDVAKVFPDNLPIKPFNLLNFPGDHLKFNLTIISGDSNTYDINIPSSIQGLSFSVDKPSIDFTEGGIDLIELDIAIKNIAKAGLRNFELNISSDGQIYDRVDIKLDIHLPEYRVLMESYHGVNDWFPDFSFNQMGFFEAMNDLAEMNISIDYQMEHWTPDYNKYTNNSILTEEKLAQYDIVILQTPILPFSPLEINNLRNYFDNGGNLIFLGTRYQDMAVENVNYLFSQLDLGIQMNEENIMDDKWLGIGASVTSQPVYNFTNNYIFNNVSKFYWGYGNSFNVLNAADSIATLSNATVVAFYNGTTEGKGQFLAFGDLHWIYNKYKSQNYAQDHATLLKNIINSFLSKREVSINIELNSERTSSSQNEISLYLKYQKTESPITSYGDLELTIQNEAYSQSIILDTSLSNEGIYFNNSFSLPSPSYIPYSIIANLTIDSKQYNKETKILYYNQSKVPKILNITTSQSSVSRESGSTINLIAKLDKTTYANFEGFLSIYSYSFFNTKTTVNKTLKFDHISNEYIETFNPDASDPSGQAIFYVIPSNDNYSTPNSPRFTFQIINNPPEILKSSSTFNIDGNQDIYFKDTETDKHTNVYSASQGSKINFIIDAKDSVNYEDKISELRVFVNLIIATVSGEGYLIFIYPSNIIVDELLFQSDSSKYEGTFIIPNNMEYDSISGTKSISTATNFDSSTGKGYLGVLYITVYDSEGKYDDFLIVVTIASKPIDMMMILLIVLPIIAVIAIASMLLYYSRRRKRRQYSQTQPGFRDYYYQPSYEPQEQTYTTPEPIPELGPGMYCPFCGKLIKTPKKFCPNCGESLDLNKQNE